MKKFKQFLEENLTRGVFREDVSIHPYYPNLNNNPLNPNPPVNQQPGGIGLWYGPNRPRPTIEESIFFIYDENGNIIGTDFNGDGQADTDEEIQEWIESGGLDNVPSDWIGDQDSFGARFILFLKAFWELGQWVIPAARIARTVTGLVRLLIGAAQYGILIYDILDFRDLIQFLIENSNLFPELYQLLQTLIGESGNIFNQLLQLLQNQWENLTNPSPTIPKLFYRFGENGTLQLWRFNPNSGTWEPFGEPISIEDYINMCQTGNCPPLQGNSDIPFYPPLPDSVIPNFVDEPPIDLERYRQYPTNNHWNQQAPGGGSGIFNDPPNPNIFQM